MREQLNLCAIFFLVKLQGAIIKSSHLTGFFFYFSLEVAVSSNLVVKLKPNKLSKKWTVTITKDKTFMSTVLDLKRMLHQGLMQIETN